MWGDNPAIENFNISLMIPVHKKNHQNEMLKFYTVKEGNQNVENGLHLVPHCIVPHTVSFH